MTLDKRLLAAASLVRRGSPVCDVGTDHGYLAAYLAMEGISGQVSASDKNPKPLAAARRTLEANGLAGRVELFLSDGLADVPPQKAMDVVMAGMGGELIASLVLGWLHSREPERRFILQPMTRAAHLRRSLCENGFAILREIPVLEEGRRYAVLLAGWDGVVRTPDPVFELVGRIPEEPTPAAAAFLRGERDKLLKVAAGLEKTAGRADEAAEKRRIAGKLDVLLKEVQPKCL